MPREGSPAAPFTGYPSPASSVFQERTCALGHLNSVRVAFKPYPCCHYNHAFMDCAARLRREHAVTPEAIDTVECFREPLAVLRERPLIFS